MSRTTFEKLGIPSEEKAIGGIISSRLQINIVMSLDFP